MFAQLVLARKKIVHLSIGQGILRIVRGLSHLKQSWAELEPDYLSLCASAGPFADSELVSTSEPAVWSNES